MSHRSCVLKSLVCCAAMLGVDAAVAGEEAISADAWRFQVTPYVWMAGLDGSVRPFRGAPTANVSKSFSDILQDLDVAFFLAGTARKGNLVLHADLSHASTSNSASLPLGLSARAEVRQTSMTLTGGYNWQLGQQSSLDLLGGARLWNINAKVNIANLASARSRTTFVDPVVAVRWRYDFAPRWSSLAYVDAGGFGVGSDFTWQLLGTINYQVRDNFYLSLGYRHLHVDYRSGGTRLDFGQGGPLIGATFQF